MSQGLGIDDFLSGGDSGGRKWLHNWKKDGSIIVVLHTQQTATKKNIAWQAWSHPFNMRDTKKNDAGKEEEILRFVRFISPDASIVSENQYFRNRPGDPGVEGELRTPPILDPFLLLREFLREEVEAGRMGSDQVVFEWTDPAKNNALIQWRAGKLARLEKQTKQTWSHTLDSKLEYFFVVADAAKPGAGGQIVRATKGLGEKMREEIKAQIDSNGTEAGNPLITPYAFKWTFDKDQPPATMYGAKRFNRQEITEEIAAAINSDSFPDPSNDTQPKPGDKAAIRAAFEDAAQIDLPWDLLFVDEWEDKKPNSGSEFSDDGPPDPTMGDRTPEVDTTAATPAPATGKGPRKRRRKKKVEKPVWWIAESDRVHCDDCNLPMHPGWAKCPKCGAEYDLEGEAPVPLPTMDVLESTEGWIGQAETASEPKQESKPEPSGDHDEGDDKCWSCGHPVSATDVQCPNCNIDLGDDIPF